MDTTEEAIFLKMKELLMAQLDLEDWEITGSSHLLEDFHAGSKEQVKLLSSLEKLYHLKIPAEEIMQQQTMNDWIQTLRRHILRDLD